MCFPSATHPSGLLIRNQLPGLSDLHVGSIAKSSTGPPTQLAEHAPRDPIAFPTHPRGSPRHHSVHKVGRGPNSATSAPLAWLPPPSLRKGLRQDGPAKNEESNFGTIISSWTSQSRCFQLGGEFTDGLCRGYQVEVSILTPPAYLAVWCHTAPPAPRCCQGLLSAGMSRATTTPL